MVNKRNHLMYHFLITFVSTSPVFAHKIRLKKWLGEMLIEQNVEWPWQGKGAVHVLQYLVNFMIKQKSLRKIFKWIIIYN